MEGLDGAGGNKAGYWGRLVQSTVSLKKKKKVHNLGSFVHGVAVPPSPIYHPAGRKGGSEETVGKYCDKECVQRAHHGEEHCPDKRPHQ